MKRQQVHARHGGRPRRGARSARRAGAPPRRDEGGVQRGRRRSRATVGRGADDESEADEELSRCRPLAALDRRAHGHTRPFSVSLGWTLRDYAKRVWDNSGEDNVLFLAGGIAFNILLAALPFILLLAAGMTYLLPLVYAGTINSTEQVGIFLDRLLPAHVETDSPVHKLINDLLRTRSSITIYSAIGFVWFSTRLFGSLRTVLASVFDIESERGIIAGKIFDVKITIVSTLLFVGQRDGDDLCGHWRRMRSSTVGLRTDVHRAAWTTGSAESSASCSSR